ncbi:PREDICTED: uncharacterized protein LOC105954554 [Erythranthe guttata]|uniref:uncharacterized protein LOC105954554 n=1 Tax=Erythranthe guttata TaxID=4155 RepID=UPI00064DE44D|nr:PREDICTED: uncharacterized protein LOC105954554 [Erythranthe guttata]|eukprot:XP_012833679.1 PREDICTED: uncharacterized protein LOC105954554 [Erythranthe guttata]
MKNEEAMKTEDLVSWCKSYLANFRSAQLRPNPNLGQTHPTEWQPPEFGGIKINFDVAVRQGTSAFSVACVARNHEGRCLAWKVKRCNGKLQPVEGEALAALQAVLLAKANRWADISLEGDCLPVIKALCAGSGETLHYGAIIEECLFLSQNFSSCKFSFVKWEGNHLAHKLAHLPCSDTLEGFELPVNLVRIITLKLKL